MTKKTIQIRGSIYDAPDRERLNRSQIRAIKPIAQRLDEGDVEALWDILQAFMPQLPEEVLDDLCVAEVKQILGDTGVVKLDPDDQTPADGATLGESSASTSSSTSMAGQSHTTSYASASDSETSEPTVSHGQTSSSSSSTLPVTPHSPESSTVSGPSGESQSTYSH